MFELYFTKQALKDAKKARAAGLKPNIEKLLEILKTNPYQTPPSFEKLVGDLEGTYSRRINIQHRLIYQIYQKPRAIKIIRMWASHE